MEDDIYHYDSDGNSTGFSSRRPPKKSLDFSPIILIAIFAIVVAWNYVSIYKLIGSYEKYEFPFTLLADEDKSVIEAFGVWGPKKFMGREYDGINRTTFIIDENGIIENVITDVKTKVHANQIMTLSS